MLVPSVRRVDLLRVTGRHHNSISRCVCATVSSANRNQGPVLPRVQSSFRLLSPLLRESFTLFIQKLKHIRPREIITIFYKAKHSFNSLIKMKCCICVWSQSQEVVRWASRCTEKGNILCPKKTGVLSASVRFVRRVLNYRT